MIPDEGLTATSSPQCWVMESEEYGCRRMDETWKTSLKAALRQLGTQLPADDDEQSDDEWMLPFEGLRTAPRGVMVRWYSDSQEDADHVYSDWMDVCVIWPPGRAPRGPGLSPDGTGPFMADEESSWVWVVVEPSDADSDTWTHGSRVFSRALAIEPDVGSSGWSCSSISRTLSGWCGEVLGRADLTFHCCH